VALRAGVSPATVSSVLTGVRPVAEESRRLVEEAVEALGFKVNHMASSLRRGRTRTVGVVVPDLASAFYASLVREYEAHAARTGYEILVVASGEDPAVEASRIESLIARRVDGLLVVAARDDFGAHPGFPAGLPPTVLVDAAFGRPGFDTIASDNLGAGRMGCDYLLGIGHRDIALLTPDTDRAHLRDRAEGYRDALIEAGLGTRARVVMGGLSIEGCRAAIEQELRRPDPPSAIFAVTYFAAIGAIKAIQATNLSFPDDISLIGFAHAEWMTGIRPYITAISQAYDELAVESWRILQERIAGSADPPARIRLPCRMAIRESARPPRPAIRPKRSASV
jgi:LacI family transcriptional regulator